MIRNLKALGLALIAVFALSALAASTAAATDHFTAEQEEAVFTTTDSHNNIFKITNASGGTISAVECTTATFAGTFKSGATQLTAWPTYSGTINQTSGTHEHCTATGGATKATIEMNECDYNLSGETTGSDNGTDATVWITCPETSPGSGKFKEITIVTNAGCTLHIPPQTPTSGGVVYTNITHNGKKAIEVHATSTGITFTSTGALCGLGGIPSEGNNSDYTGTIIATCYKDEGPGPGGKKDEFKDGTQIGCEVS